MGGDLLVERAEGGFARPVGGAVEERARPVAVAFVDREDGGRVAHGPVDERADGGRAIEEVPVADLGAVRERAGERADRAAEDLDALAHGGGRVGDGEANEALGLPDRFVAIPFEREQERVEEEAVLEGGLPRGPALRFGEGGARLLDPPVGGERGGRHQRAHRGRVRGALHRGRPLAQHRLDIPGDERAPRATTSHPADERDDREREQDARGDRRLLPRKAENARRSRSRCHEHEGADQALCAGLVGRHSSGTVAARLGHDQRAARKWSEEMAPTRKSPGRKPRSSRHTQAIASGSRRWGAPAELRLAGGRGAWPLPRELEGPAFRWSESRGGGGAGKAKRAGGGGGGARGGGGGAGRGGRGGGGGSPRGGSPLGPDLGSAALLTRGTASAQEHVWRTGPKMRKGPATLAFCYRCSLPGLAGFTARCRQTHTWGCRLNERGRTRTHRGVQAVPSGGGAPEACGTAVVSGGFALLFAEDLLLRAGGGLVQRDELDAEALGETEDALVAVELAEDDAADAGVGDHLEAAPAGRGGDVDRRALDADAVARGLDDGVRLGVDGAHAVAVLHHVALFVAVLACRGWSHCSRWRGCSCRAR